jgi:hypothetical protein
MGDLEDLKKEAEKLEAQQSVRNEFDLREMEKRKVKKRIFRLKHPSVVKVINIGKTSIKGIGMMAKMGFEKAKPYLVEGAKNFASNSQDNFNSPFQEPRQRRKVVKVRKIKRKRRR